MRRTKSERDAGHKGLTAHLAAKAPLPVPFCIMEIDRLRADIADAEAEIAAILDKFCGPNPYKEKRWQDDISPNPPSGNSEGI